MYYKKNIDIFKGNCPLIRTWYTEWKIKKSDINRNTETI